MKKLLFILFCNLFFLNHIYAGSTCNSPEFGAKYATYEAVDKAGPGAPAMAMLAIAGGPQSTHYKKIAELAQKSKVFADLKSFMDGLNAENDRVLKRVKAISATNTRLSKEFDSAYGKEWDKKADIQQKFVNRLNIETKSALDLIDEAAGKKPSEYKPYEVGKDSGQLRSNLYVDYYKNVESLLAKSPPAMRSIYEALARHSNFYVAATTGRIMMSSWGSETGSRVRKTIYQDTVEEANRAAREYRNGIKAMTDTTSGIERSFGPKENRGGQKWYNFQSEFDTNFGKLAKIGAAVAGTVAAGGAIAQGVAVDAASLAKLKKIANECGPKLGITNTGALASSIDPKTAFFENPDCNNLNIKPEALVELQGNDGNYSAASCQLLEDRLAKYQARYDQDFTFDPQNCNGAQLKIGDKTIGSFSKVDSSQAYFDIAPGQSKIGAKFYIQNNGGVDFDPQGVECYRMVGDNQRQVPDCSSTIKGSLMRGSQGGLSVSQFQSRQALFHSQKGCRAIGNQAYSEAYCGFSDNADTIRLANSLYNVSCMSGQGGQSQNGNGGATLPANGVK